jgi:hypothetical protein
VLRYFFECQVSEHQISEQHIAKIHLFELPNFQTDICLNYQFSNVQNFQTKIGCTRGYLIVIGPDLPNLTSGNNYVLSSPTARQGQYYTLRGVSWTALISDVFALRDCI